MKYFAINNFLFFIVIKIIDVKYKYIRPPLIESLNCFSRFKKSKDLGRSYHKDVKSSYEEHRIEHSYRKNLERKNRKMLFAFSNNDVCCVVE